MINQLSCVIIQPQPIQRRGNRVEVVLPATGQMRAKPNQNLGRIAPLKQPSQEEAIVNRIIGCSCAEGFGRITSGLAPFEIADSAQVRHAEIPHHLDRLAMSQQHVMHGTRRGADIAQAWRMMPVKMAEPTDTPRLVDRRGGPNPVADPAHDRGGEIGKPTGNIAVPPAAQIGQSAWKFPVIERRRRFDAAFQQSIDQSVVEIQPVLIHLAAPVRQNPRPRGGEAIGISAQISQQIQIRIHPVVVIAGDGAVFGAHNIAGRGGKTVPLRRARAAKAMALDLIGRGGGAEDEVVRKICAGKIHITTSFTRCRQGRGRWSGRRSIPVPTALG